MALSANKLEQLITIKTELHPEGVAVITDLEPGFGDEDEDAEFMAKTLITVLYNVFPEALQPQFIAHIDQMRAATEDPNA